jgi:hypothetical protein
VEQQIAKSVKDLIENTTHLVKDLKPETQVKAEAAVVAEIKKASRNGIAALNQMIERDLRIPENVLLMTDILQSSTCSQDDINNLSEDCQRLEMAVVQVRWKRGFGGEAIQQIYLQNAYLIHSLTTELDSYSTIRELVEMEDFVTGSAFEWAESSMNIDLLSHTVKKMQPFH